MGGAYGGVDYCRNPIGEVLFVSLVDIHLGYYYCRGCCE